VGLFYNNDNAQHITEIIRRRTAGKQVGDVSKKSRGLIFCKEYHDSQKIRRKFVIRFHIHRPPGLLFC